MLLRRAGTRRRQILVPFLVDPREVEPGSSGVDGRLLLAQRFAIDWMLLDANAKFNTGNGKSVEDYADYGAKVIAVADGTVDMAASPRGSW